MFTIAELAAGLPHPPPSEPPPGWTVRLYEEVLAHQRIADADLLALINSDA